MLTLSYPSGLLVATAPLTATLCALAVFSGLLVAVVRVFPALEFGALVGTLSGLLVGVPPLPPIPFAALSTLSGTIVCLTPYCCLPSLCI